MTNLQGPEILELLMAVDELNIQTLVSCAQKHLINNNKEFLQQNLIEILQTVCQNELFTDLLSYYLENIKYIIIIYINYKNLEIFIIIKIFNYYQVY